MKKLIVFYIFNFYSFLNIVVRWFGVIYDFFVFGNFLLLNIMGLVNGWLLGDFGYFFKKWFLIFFLDLRIF